MRVTTLLLLCCVHVVSFFVLALFLDRVVGLLCLFVCPLFVCSTSPSGGNQVDGLPPAPVSSIDYRLNAKNIGSHH